MSKEQQKRRLQDAGSGQPSIISEDCSFTGSFAGASDLIVLGTMIGDCKLESTVIIEKMGRWQGSVQARNVVINGVVKGDVTARERLEVGAQARIEGSVTAGSLAIATGANIDGETNITGQSAVTQFKDRRA